MKTETILVIEDDKMNMKLTGTLLQFEKDRVVGAEDAATGIRI